MICEVLTSTPTKDIEKQISEKKLKRYLKSLFDYPAEIALFFFAGHGVLNDLGGYLVTQDARQFDEGVSFYELMHLANNSKVREIVIILDCCHSGNLGVTGLLNATPLREGITILAASSSHQYARENKENGLFTHILLEGLNGGAADIKGEVTLSSLYNYADQMFSPWEQRPIYKCHVNSFISMRQCEPRVSIENLRRIKDLFLNPDYRYPLDPSYEFTAEPKDEDHEDIFQLLQQFATANLVEPVDEKYMYFAAINEKSCALTPMGKFYWNLVDKGQL